ncbi:MAG TPA: proline racemase family protein [Streptosporangiaceae bacterium]
MTGPAIVATADYHTAGEPFRIVTGGVAVPPGATVADRRVSAMARLDHVRRLLTDEPRGHPGMYGCFVTPPDDDGAELGVIFFHRSGFSTACGHGTIALATWARQAGLVPPDLGAFSIDVPSGRVRVLIRGDGASPEIAFRNVGAWVAERGRAVDTPLGPARVDIAFGGAFYASVSAAALGLSVEEAQLPHLIAAGQAIQRSLDAAGAARHPSDDRLSGIYGVIFYEELPAGGGQLHQRNVTVFGDGQVDRSPCGSGTTTRLALLAGHGLAPGQALIHDSIIGTRFTGRVLSAAEVNGRPMVATEVSGRAYLTGLHQFLLAPDDPLGTGFALG